MSQSVILVVDDNVGNLRSVDQFLKQYFKTVLMTSGEQALRYLEQNRPDLILLDIEMRGMNGYETIKRIKANPVTGRIPVIFFTERADNESELAGLGHGAADYVSKPVIQGLLLHRIRMQLELDSFRYHMEKLVDQKTEQLLQMKRITINALASLAECRDPHTGGHIKRTSLYVEVLARALRGHPHFHDSLDNERIENIISAAPLHDIGKMGIPDAILLKEGKLTDEEFTVMKTHVLVGEQTLRTATMELGFPSFLDEGREMSVSHHERWDGSGYPHRLAGEEIPLAGRIMAVADVFDALVTRRPYKDAMSHEKAVQIILNGRGTHFDPNIVDVFSTLTDSFKQILESCSA